MIKPFQVGYKSMFATSNIHSGFGGYKIIPVTIPSMLPDDSFFIPALSSGKIRAYEALQLIFNRPRAPDSYRELLSLYKWSVNAKVYFDEQFDITFDQLLVKLEEITDKMSNADKLAFNRFNKEYKDFDFKENITCAIIKLDQLNQVKETVRTLKRKYSELDDSNKEDLKTKHKKLFDALNDIKDIDDKEFE